MSNDPKKGQTHVPPLAPAYLMTILTKKDIYMIATYGF